MLNALNIYARSAEIRLHFLLLFFFFFLLTTSQREAEKYEERENGAAERTQSETISRFG